MGCSLYSPLCFKRWNRNSSCRCASYGQLPRDAHLGHNYKDWVHFVWLERPIWGEHCIGCKQLADFKQQLHCLRPMDGNPENIVIRLRFWQRKCSCRYHRQSNRRDSRTAYDFKHKNWLHIWWMEQRRCYLSCRWNLHCR